MAKIKSDIFSKTCSTEAGVIAYIHWLIYRWKPKSAKSAHIFYREFSCPELDSSRIDCELLVEVDYYSDKRQGHFETIDLSVEPERGYEIRNAQGNWIFHETYPTDEQNNPGSENFDKALKHFIEKDLAWLSTSRQG